MEKDSPLLHFPFRHRPHPLHLQLVHLSHTLHPHPPRHFQRGSTLQIPPPSKLLTLRLLRFVFPHPLQPIPRHLFRGSHLLKHRHALQLCPCRCHLRGRESTTVAPKILQTRTRHRHSLIHLDAPIASDNLPLVSDSTGLKAADITCTHTPGA